MAGGMMMIFLTVQRTTQGKLISLILNMLSLMWWKAFQPEWNRDSEFSLVLRRDTKLNVQSSIDIRWAPTESMNGWVCSFRDYEVRRKEMKIKLWRTLSANLLITQKLIKGKRKNQRLRRHTSFNEKHPTKRSAVHNVKCRRPEDA